jgi:hypothetical protein
MIRILCTSIIIGLLAVASAGLGAMAYVATQLLFAGGQP